MNSIRSKFLALTIVGILLCSFVIGGTGLWIVRHLQDTSSTQILELNCKDQAGKLNAQLISIRDSVQVIADAAIANLPEMDTLHDEKVYGAYLEKMNFLMGSIAQSTKGACAYYLRMEPELSSYEAGLFYSRGKNEDHFRQEILTDLRIYAPDDTEHVGWFYQPEEAGHAIWMEPYYNLNLDVYMVSYVIPLYKDGVFFGVTGMDLDFPVVVEEIRNINTFRSGNVILLSRDGTVYYHPELKEGSNLAEEIPSTKVVVENIKKIDEEDEGVYSDSGEERKIAYASLYNGMYLILSAGLEEINTGSDSFSWVIIGTALAVSVLFSIFVLIYTNRITKTLHEVMEAANQISNGNMQVEVSSSRKDEVGQLVNTFANTAQYLQSSMSNMKNTAYRDALTGVKNKASYDQMLLRLEEDMEEGKRTFALVVGDLNDLKLINDTYGHDRGDEYLRCSCMMLCKIFKHSPVYRIGGDEFVVLLENEDMGNREKLLEELEKGMELSRQEPSPWKRVSLAIGISECQEADTSPTEVFRRADREMYLRKRRMKGDHSECRDKNPEEELVTKNKDQE